MCKMCSCAVRVEFYHPRIVMDGKLVLTVAAICATSIKEEVLIIGVELYGRGEVFYRAVEVKEVVIVQGSWWYSAPLSGLSCMAVVQCSIASAM